MIRILARYGQKLKLTIEGPDVELENGSVPDGAPLGGIHDFSR
jgi:hypothetical protein